MSEKEELINDIEIMLNNHGSIGSSSINPSLLEFMDTKTLKDIIGSLLDQKSSSVEDNQEWLNGFKKEVVV